MKCLVNFQYLDDSIRCTDGRWYPMILMDWVEGDTLFKWVNKKCSERNGAALSAAADCWLSLTRELTEAQVAHGDLQHNNIIVTPEGRLKLVDYDCMSVPGLLAAAISKSAFSRISIPNEVKTRFCRRNWTGILPL